MTLLHFAGYQPAASIHTRAASHFGKLLRDALGDDVEFRQTVSILDEGRPAGDLAPLVADGTYSMCYLSTIRFARHVPALSLFDAPFVIGDRGRVWRALEGRFGADIKAAFAKDTPWRVLGFWDNGFRQISNRVRPLRSPADCAGLSIRVQQTDDIVDTFARIGFDVRSIDISEAVRELTAGRIDAQENPLTSINAFGIQKLHKHITLTGHIFGVALLLANAQQYEKWPQAVRDAVHDAAGEATDFQRKLAVEQDDSLRAAFAADGVAFVDLSADERAAFADAARPVADRLTAPFEPDLLARLRG